MPLAFLDSGSSECVEYDANRLFGFRRPGENSEALLQKSAYGKIDRTPESRFTNPNIAYPRERKCSQLSTIHVEGEQVPEIFDTTQMVWLNVALLVTRSARVFVGEPNFDLLENSMAQLFEEV